MKQKKSLLIFLLMFLFTCVFSQGHIENFNDGDLAGWGGQADYDLTNTGTALRVDAGKVSTWNSFTYSFSTTDISANPYVSLKIKTDVDFNLGFSIWDGVDNYDYFPGTYKEIVHSDSLTEFTFDFSSASVDLTTIDMLNFVFNPEGANRCNATVYIDDIRIGDQAMVMPSMTNIQDQYHKINCGAVNVPFWGVDDPVSGGSPISVSAVSSNTGLIPNPSVNYSDPDATGSFSYTPVADQTGTATITVTVSGNAPDDNVFTFDVHVEPNYAPEVDQADDINIVAGEQTDVTLTGLADGNPNAEQSLTVTASSSSPAVVPDPNVVYTDGDFESTVELVPTIGETGTVTITITVQDDGGTVNGGVDTKVMTFDATVYEDVNNPPAMEQPDDVSILEDEPEQTIELTEITDGDDDDVQGISITATSSNPDLIPDPTIVYTSGLNSGELKYTAMPDSVGTATITVTLTDDGGAGNNNGNESTVYTFDVQVRVRPIIGWEDEFNDGVLGPQWPATWGVPGEGCHLCTESGGEMHIQIDKSKENNKWAGLWFNIPNELDLSENPYISIRMKTDQPGTEMLIFLWDAYDHYNTNETVRHTVTDSYVEYYFDFSDPDKQLQKDGTPVDISRIKALLFNFDPGGAVDYQGDFYFDDLRIGDKANTVPITPNVTMDTIPDFVVLEDASEQTINIAGLSDGGDGSNQVTITAVSNNTGLIPDPTESDVSNQSATLKYTPVAGQTGTATITITAAASGSISKELTFDIDVVELTAGTADDITIDLTTEYQEIDGFGAFMGSGNVYNDTIITLAEDIGMSMARVGIIGGGFEEVNDNSDPNIINLDAYNPSAISMDNIRRIAPFVDKFILTVWSPAGWMKTNKTEDGVDNWATDNKLEPRHYDEYAEEIVAAIEIIKRETGVTLYGIGPQNEPQFNEPYPSCQVDWNEFRDLINVIGPKLDAEGLGDVKIFWAEALPAQGRIDDYINAVKSDATAHTYADIVAIHNYDSDGASVGGAGCSDWSDIYSWAQTPPGVYKTWMTETSGMNDNWDGAMTLAGNIFNALDCGNASAWVFWSFSSGSPRYSLVVSNRPSSRYYVSKQYYKWIRPGAVRVDVTSTGIPSIAFKDDANGTVTVILFNNTGSAQTIEINGSNLPGSWQSYTSSNARNCERGPDVGADGLIALPPSSLTTLVGYSNNAPTIDPIANEVIIENSPAQNVDLKGISDGDGGTQNLTITAASDNESLIPDPSVTYTSGNATGTLSYTPASDISGVANITVTVSDDGSPAAETVETFKITVQGVNHEPVMNNVFDVNIDEDAGQQTVNLTGIGDGDGNTQNLDVSVSGGNVSLISSPLLSYTPNASTGTITFTPEADANGGPVTITVTVTDDGGTANGGDDTYETTFDINIAAINDEPVINAIADQNAVPSTPKTINLSGIADGDPETQGISISASSNNTGYVPHPTVNYTSDNTTGSLEFTPVAEGVATITVTVKDDAGTGNGGDDTYQITFDVNVSSTVNENPVIDNIDDENINEDAGSQTVSLLGIGDGDASLTQALSVTAESSDETIVPDPVVNYTSDDATGTLVYTPAADANGSVTITVTVTDDGTPTASSIEQFAINITAVNDEPTISTISDPAAVLEGAGEQVVNMTGISDGDDGSQAISITATSSNTTLIPSVNVNYSSGATGSLSYTPAAGENGSSVITVTVKDDGGTVYGGDDEVVETFTVTVNSVNNTPTLNNIASPSNILEDHANTVDISLLNITDGGDGGQNITVTAEEVTVGGDLLTNLTVDYTSPASTGTVSYDVLPGVHGDAVVYVIVKDDGGTANGSVDTVFKQFIQTITTVNDQPECDPISDVTDAEAGSFEFVFLENLSDGDGGSSQVSVTAVADDTLLIPVITYDDNNESLYFDIPEGVSGTTTITVTITDGDGITNGGVDELVLTFDFTVKSTSVSEIAQDKIMLYPNPASDFVKINIGDNRYSEMIITDIAGRSIKRIDMSDVNDEYELDVSSLSDGLYMITMIGEQGNCYARFIVE